MTAAPTSIRLTPDLDARLDRLLGELPRTPLGADLAAVTRGGELTRGAVLRLALERGIAGLEREISQAGEVPRGR